MRTRASASDARNQIILKPWECWARLRKLVEACESKWCRRCAQKLRTNGFDLGAMESFEIVVEEHDLSKAGFADNVVEIDNR